MPELPNPAVVAAKLRTLATDIELGAVALPLLRHVGGIPVVPVLLHEALCTWRVKTEQPTTPAVLGCAGCGLAVLKSEAVAAS